MFASHHIAMRSTAEPPSLVTQAHQQRPHSHANGIRAHTVLLVILPTISLSLIVALLLILVLIYRPRSSSNRAEKLAGNAYVPKNLSAPSVTSSPGDVRKCGYIARPPSKFRGGGQVFTYRELELATDKFSEENVIGNGGFGVVYRGVLTDGTQAAIKRLNRDGKQGDRDFRVEVDLLSRLQSPYLVQLIGYCADANHRILVFELMSNGNLREHLNSNGQEGSPAYLDWGTRLRIALDGAKGLEYLHEKSTPVIHRDFKTTNILLDHDYRGKISDFGLAKFGSQKPNGLVSTRVLGTTGYVAPEYAMTGKLTTKSDVYSFGVVLLELITGRVPVDMKRPADESVLVSWALPKLTNREKVQEMVDPVLEGQYSYKELIQYTTRPFVTKR
ncbi:probable serine/threonine-protein kinase PBL7 isoform X2 [Amborella trichopoda]|uniref:probable serine/threonine-protein kinase PBL7 isoform X2 n=1 Tax=Amborella trichopoda TaxID=13333 RepID=UPI0009C071BF|nr:probable serine/threonine-protein kinase PBL7 isoform X2 [Amborella trichopoda]|eukprot:XP_020526851.1 probable serine/threonine-protein kinase PBL7 isoform X2 [Amborella trichopoda]